MIPILPEIRELKPYVPGRTIAGGLKLSANENPLGASPRALAALREALATAALNRYPDGGVALLRDRIAAFWSIGADQVLVGNGSDEILVMIAGAFIAPGLNSVTAAHTFSQYTFVTRIFGGELRTAPMPKGKIDLSAIRSRIDEKTRLVFLCNPNNPTATSFSHRELEAFLGDLPDHVVVVLDEAYGEFADVSTYPDALSLMERWENLIRLRTFSKIYGLAGMRVGYANARPELIDAVSRLRQPFNVDSLAQIAAHAALDDEEFVAASVENNTRGRIRLCDALQDLGVDFPPSDANFVCAHIGPDADTVVAALADRKIAIRPLRSFGLPEHVRLSIGTPEETDSLIRALTQVLQDRAHGST